MGLSLSLPWQEAWNSTIEVSKACPNVSLGVCDTLNMSTVDEEYYGTCENCKGFQPELADNQECPVCLSERSDCILAQKCSHAICASCFKGPSLKIKLAECRKCPEYIVHTNEFCQKCALDELEILKVQDHHASILKVLRICPVCRSALRTPFTSKS